MRLHNFAAQQHCFYALQNTLNDHEQILENNALASSWFSAYVLQAAIRDMNGVRHDVRKRRATQRSDELVTGYMYN